MPNRITIQTPIDGLLFWKMSGHEAISQPFSLNVVLLGTDARIDRSALLGQPLTVTIPTQNALSPRYFNGKVTGVAVSAVELSGSRYAAYTLTVESDLWPMQRDRNMRIFQEQTVPQIVKTLLAEYQVNVEDALIENHRVWDYSVQYQESSFDFISRLMELEGIAYYFRHEKDKHTLVLVDSAEQYQPAKGYEIIPYQHTPSGGSTTTEGIAQWAIADFVTPGLYSLDDYDFRKPNAWLHQARQNPSSPQPGKIDVYDWPGRFVDHGHGETYARIRQQRWQVEHHRINGTATALGIAPGTTFLLSNAPFFSDNGEYLTTEAHYQFEENRYASGADNNTHHQIDFSVIPSTVVFRPAQATSWPRTYGPQTAKVVGPQGESIWTDRYGRVKVKFHWDRQGKGDDTCSCWVRVSSAWAGQGFGGVQIPRVNDEVVIDFINGDPDRPIVTGRVYNEASMPPWELPGDATRMGFMTRSKDGNKDNASYLFFEDRIGGETVDLHSERNMNISVENDKAVNIDGHRTTKIGKTQNDEVVGDASFYYQAKRTTTVDKEETATFNQGTTTTISKGRKLTITDSGDVSDIKGNVTTTIDGSVNTKIKNGWQYLTLEDGSMWVKISTGGRGVEIQNGDELLVHSGGQKNIITGGVNTTITGNWEQKVTNGDITISTPGTITIKGDTKVDIQAPDWYEFKAIALALKLNESSFGLTEIASRGFKYETNPAQIKLRGNTGFEVHVNGVQVKKDIVSIKNAALQIIT
ncbi:type VI secretion system Vgr family protein [Cronobacter dublinensis]